MTDNYMLELTSRLNRLERTNRNMRRGLFALGIGGIVLFSVGAALPDQGDDRKDVSFGTLHASKIVISDEDGHDRLVLALESGEPNLKMFDHDGRRQIFLGIDEFWEDAAYLSVSSRLGNGNIDKQAVIAATTSRPDSPSSSQLVLYDGHPKQDGAVRRLVARISSGLAEQKPYLEVIESSEKSGDGVSMRVLDAKPAANER